MIAYASSTGTKRNLAALTGAGWRLMFSPFSRERPGHGAFRYALDNGAWAAYQAKRPFDADAFCRMVDDHSAGADWVVLPDIVAGGKESLDFSLSWWGLGPFWRCPLMLAVQNGIEPDDVAHIVGPNLGIFIGGTSEWKEASALSWGKLAREAGARLHMGRVNSQRRIKIAQAAGCDSFDGSSVTRYAVTLPKLDSAKRQGYLEDLR